MYEGKVILTFHSKKKAKERMGIPHRALQKNAENAFLYGLSRYESVGRLRDYLDKIYFKTRKANNLRVYNRFVYIFAGKTLITVLHVPKELVPSAYSQQKKKEKLLMEDIDIWTTKL